MFLLTELKVCRYLFRPISFYGREWNLLNQQRFQDMIVVKLIRVLTPFASSWNRLHKAVVKWLPELWQISNESISGIRKWCIYAMWLQKVSWSHATEGKLVVGERMSIDAQDHTHTQSKTWQCLHRQVDGCESAWTCSRSSAQDSRIPLRACLQSTSPVPPAQSQWFNGSTASDRKASCSLESRRNGSFGYPWLSKCTWYHGGYLYFIGLDYKPTRNVIMIVCPSLCLILSNVIQKLF